MVGKWKITKYPVGFGNFEYGAVRWDKYDRRWVVSGKQSYTTKKGAKRALDKYLNI